MFYRHSNTFRKFELTPKGLIFIWISICAEAHVCAQHTLNHYSGKKKSLLLNYSSSLQFFCNHKGFGSLETLQWLWVIWSQSSIMLKKSLCWKVWKSCGSSTGSCERTVWGQLGVKAKGSWSWCDSRHPTARARAGNIAVWVPSPEIPKLAGRDIVISPQWEYDLSL